MTDDSSMWRRRIETYSGAGLVIAGDEDLLLLHGQRDRFQGRVFVFKDACVEAVLWRRIQAGLVIAQLLLPQRVSRDARSPGGYERPGR